MVEGEGVLSLLRELRTKGPESESREKDQEGKSIGYYFLSISSRFQGPLPEDDL